MVACRRPTRLRDCFAAVPPSRSPFSACWRRVARGRNPSAIFLSAHRSVRFLACWLRRSLRSSGALRLAVLAWRLNAAHAAWLVSVALSALRRASFPPPCRVPLVVSLRLLALLPRGICTPGGGRQ